MATRNHHLISEGGCTTNDYAETLDDIAGKACNTNRCAECGSILPSDEIIELAERKVCKDCLYPFLLADYVYQEYGEGFLQEYKLAFIQWLFLDSDDCKETALMSRDNCFLSALDKLDLLERCWEQYVHYLPKSKSEAANKAFIECHLDEWMNYLCDIGRRQ